jgi:hypothetical protein
VPLSPRLLHADTPDMSISLFWGPSAWVSRYARRHLACLAAGARRQSPTSQEAGYLDPAAQAAPTERGPSSGSVATGTPLRVIRCFFNSKLIRVNMLPSKRLDTRL